MLKVVIFFSLLLPLGCLAQVTISGRILNQADTKPVANASVFISNATIGDKTASDGTFKLTNVKPGKYDLIVSILGFENYSQIVVVVDKNISLPDITIFPKTIALNEVTIKFHADPDREKWLNLFKDEFLGTSAIAKDCKILNPQLLDLSYDEDAHKLTASSNDYLQIENDALGYRIKYLLTDFSLENKSETEKRVYYKGPVLFEEMKGSASEMKRWQKTRFQVYENSPMHFLRAALSNRLDEEGFRVQGVIYVDPDRPSDSLINARIKLYKDLGSKDKSLQDSLSYWVKKSKLPKFLNQILPTPLSKENLVKETDVPGQYALQYTNDAVLVAYSKSHHFHINNKFEYLYNPGNTENTLIKFNAPSAFFYGNGVITNPYSVIYYGVWGRNRVAEMLPTDFEPPQSISVPTSSSNVNNIASKLKAYDTSHISEKAYLHFDKPYYAAGDTMYFKAYVTESETHKLSSQSGVLHVDMINTESKIIQSIKLKPDSGIACGDFALPDSLPKGNYQVRAYTQLMRNVGQTDFFEKVIPVGSLKAAGIPESLVKQPASLNLNPDIQFFPEGGNLATGIRSKVAFKAIGPDGLGIEAKGVVVDNAGNEVASFASAHLGMGYFYLTPEDGKNYSAKISYSNGQQGVVNIPMPESGIILSVGNDSLSKATISIAATSSYYHDNKDKEYMLVIYSGEVPTTINFKLDNPVIKLEVLKENLHTGIAVITLFSQGNIPLCERLLFIQNNDQLDLNISSGKNSYAKREKVRMKLNVKNRVDSASLGHFSVSVINESLVPENEKNAGNILSYLLLTSDLKGYIEQPNYYFSDTGATVRDNLDVLLLTQGYRRFSWKQVLDSTARPLRFQPEKGIEIAGQLRNMLNKPIANGTVTLIPAKGGQMANTATDEKGMFRFTNLTFTDTVRFVLSAVNNKRKNSTKIICFNDARNIPAVLQNQPEPQKGIADTALAAFIKNEKLEQREVLNYFNGKPIILKVVNIRNKKPDDQYNTQSLAGAGHADQVLHSAQLGYDGPLVSRLNGVLKGVIFIKDIPYLTLSLHSAIPGNGRNYPGIPPNQMLVIVDGVETPIGVKINLQTTEVETVEVLRNASAGMYGMQGAGGVLIITTKAMRGIDPKDIASIGVLPIAPVGFYKAREFYSPKYDHPDLVSKQKDLRSTIYWKPELLTDKDGNASFEYYNADSSGTYKVVIEGIDDNGNLGHQVYRYKVE